MTATLNAILNISKRSWQSGITLILQRQCLSFKQFNISSRSSNISPKYCQTRVAILVNTKPLINKRHANILSVNENLSLTRVHLKKKRAYLTLSRQSYRLFTFHFVLDTVLYMGTTRNVIGDSCLLISVSHFHWVLLELAKCLWFLKVWISRSLVEGVTETIWMAF